MPEEEPITVEHFAKGVVSPKTGVKALAFLPWLLLFIFIGFAIYKAYFKKPPVTQDIEKVEKMYIYNAPKERPWWMPRPFTELYVYKEDDRDGWGIKGGFRWDWLP